MGFYCEASQQDMRRIVNIWRTMCEVNMPTVHVLEKEKVVVVSIATGTVIRPLRTKVIGSRIICEGPYVDTTTVYYTTMLSMAGITFPDVKEEPEQFFNATVLTIPFAAWTSEPRPNLGVQMLRQSMSTTPIKGDATIVSTGKCKQLVTTAVADAIVSYSSNTRPIVLPGKLVMTAFVNRYLNSEDACTVSKG